MPRLSLEASIMKENHLRFSEYENNIRFNDIKLLSNLVITGKNKMI